MTSPMNPTTNIPSMNLTSHLTDARPAGVQHEPAASSRRRRFRARTLLLAGTAFAALTLPLVALSTTQASAGAPADLAITTDMVAGPNFVARVHNHGGSNSGPFHAVIITDQSWGVDVGNIPPGGERLINLNRVGCQRSAVVWVDPGNTIGDQHLANNHIVIQGVCKIDNGSHGVGISDETP